MTRPRGPKAPRPGISKLSALLLLLLPAASSACGTPPPRQAILILLDAARADRFSFQGYRRPTTPVLDRVAAEGAFFREHYATATTTRASLPSLLRSRHFSPPLFPGSDRIPYSSPADLFRQPDDESISLPAAMARHGVHTAMISAHTWLGEETAFASLFDEAHDLSARLQIDPEEGYPGAGPVIDYALDWLEGMEGRDFFLYLHLMDTHFPHAPGPEALAFLQADGEETPYPESFTRAGAPAETSLPLTAGERAWLDALYDGSLRHADRHLGRLFARLREFRWAPLVMFTSDHGEALLELPGRLGHGLPAWETVSRIPWIVWWPGRLEPREVRSLTSALDATPTMMGLLDLPIPPEKSFDGRDLSGALRGGAPPEGPVAMSGALRAGRWKAIFHAADDLLLGETLPDPRDLRGKLHDLETDPQELTDLWSRRPGIAADLLARYRKLRLPAWRRYQSARREGPPPSPFAVAARHLKLRPPSPCTDDSSRVESFFGSGSGWMRFCDDQGDYLLGESGAPAVTVGIPVPSGRYRLTLGLRGSALLSRREETQAAAVAGDPFDPWDWFPWSATAIPAGEAVVEGDLLEMSIRPAPDSGPFLLEYVGFTPLGPGGEAPAEDRERLERLRSLGYVD